MTASATSGPSPCLALIAGLVISGSSGQPTISLRALSLGTDSADPDGKSSDVGATRWIASRTSLEADGDVMVNLGSAVRVFNPRNGWVNALDASLQHLVRTAAVGGPEPDWVAAGFPKNSSRGSSAGDFIPKGNVIGKSWTPFRGSNTPGSTEIFAQLGGAIGGNRSTILWSESTLTPTYAGDMDLRVFLDTTGGSGNWTVTWCVKPSASSSLTQIFPTTAQLEGEIAAAGVVTSKPVIEWTGSADGTELGGASYATGQIVQAIRFNGVDDDNSTTTAGDPRLPPINCKLMAWILRERANRSRGYVATGPTGGLTGEVLRMSRCVKGTDRILLVNRLRIGVQGDSPVRSPDDTISTGTWLYITCAVDGVNRSILYLDGSFVGANPARMTPTATIISFNIGTNTRTWPPHLSDDRDDDVAFFSGVPDVDEIHIAKKVGADMIVPKIPEIVGIESDVRSNVVLILDGPTDALTVHPSIEPIGYSDTSATASGSSSMFETPYLDPNEQGKNLLGVQA